MLRAIELATTTCLKPDGQQHLSIQSQEVARPYPVPAPSFHLICWFEVWPCHGHPRLTAMSSVVGHRSELERVFTYPTLANEISHRSTDIRRMLCTRFRNPRPCQGRGHDESVSKMVMVQEVQQARSETATLTFGNPSAMYNSREYHVQAFRFPVFAFTQEDHNP